ncbi:MAG: efflux RND transporter periplasmic adaptor subunit [Armatimonadota bacterium]|nr:efflux RND transporter periplasmic adaptor subunit [bacterium]
MNDQPQEQLVPNNAIRRRIIIAAIAIAILLVAGIVYWLLTRGRISTDDAQVQGHLVPINPRVNGYVHNIYVDDNQLVNAGHPLVLLDRRDLAAKLRQQEAALASQSAQAAAARQQVALVSRTAPASELQAGAVVGIAQAGIAASGSQIASAVAQYRAAQAGVVAAQGAVENARSAVETATAQVTSARATLRSSQADVTSAAAQAERTSKDLARNRELFHGGAVSRQQFEIAEAANTTAQANLAAARDKVDAARASVTQARSGVSGAQGNLRQANARLSAAVNATNQALAGVNAARAAQAQSLAQLRQAEAAQAGASTAPQQISSAEAQARSAIAKVKQALADVKSARLQYSYTNINAPVTGVVSQKSVEPGQFVQPGQALMSIVPLSQTWVVANYKETQTGRMHPGQLAIIEVDSYPGLRLRGRVQSIGAATGARFSLLPPENATGNFVKVVQRIPVKITFVQRIPRGVVLRLGQNVTATVYAR